MKTGLICFLLSLSLLACSNTKPLQPISFEMTQQAPFEMELLSEVNDGENLTVQGKVTSATAWKSDDVIVVLKGLSEGKVVDLAYKTLGPDSAMDYQISLGQRPFPVFLPGQPKEVELSISSQGVGEYQLELLWGQEARSFNEVLQLAKSKVAVPKVRNLQVKRIRQNCYKAPCPITMQLVGELFNDSEQILDSIKLAIGIVRVEDPNRSQGAENEEILNVTDLALAPNSARPLRIGVNRQIPENVAYAYQPILRVLEYSYRESH